MVISKGAVWAGGSNRNTYVSAGRACAPDVRAQAKMVSANKTKGKQQVHFQVENGDWKAKELDEDVIEFTGFINGPPPGRWQVWFASRIVSVASVNAL